jgi:hypothetical protein
MSKVTIDGRQAHYLLFALDHYVETNIDGKVCPLWPRDRSHGFKYEEIQDIRDMLFAAHEHDPEEYS